MTALQKIIKEAQSIRKKFPKIEWKKAVAQASAIYSRKPKSKVVKKTAVKKTAKKKIGKVDKKLKKTLSKKGLKMPHGYDVVKRKRKIGAVKKTATKKAPVVSKHKDTKSHNVNIRVMSGMDNYPIRFTRLTNDIYGNPRYAVHFVEFLNSEENAFIPFSKKYEYALKKAKKLGGKKFDNKQYGGGIAFQSYNIQDLEKRIVSLRNTTPKIKI